MPKGIVSDTTKSAKNLAQQIAKQMAREPSEILRDVREQTSGQEISDSENNINSSQSTHQNDLEHHQKNQTDVLKSARRIEALNRELDDIRKYKIFKNLQERITNGETISLNEYPELTMEQKQVLQAQMEAVKKQNANLRTQNFSDVPSITSKPSRRFGAGQKQAAQKEQTHVEKPVPPSG